MLLSFLLKDYRFINRETLKKKTGFSIVKLNSLMFSLKRSGYEISSHPNLGFRLEVIPDRLDLNLIKAGVNTSIIGQEIYVFSDVTSTNDAIFDIANKESQEGTVVLSRMQTKGRGRHGRVWISPKGGIYISILLKPRIDFKRIHVFNLIGAIAVAESLKKLYDIPVTIKWPNDVFVHDKKIAGILSEARVLDNGTSILIVGVGINIKAGSGVLPSEATSLNKYVKGKLSGVTIILKVLENLETQYKLYKEHKFKKIIDNWKYYSSLVGRQVKISSMTGNIYEGYVNNIDPISGAIILRFDNGLEKSILEGTVEIIR